MHRIFFVVLVCFPFLASAQTADSVALKTVDSLIQASRSFIGKQDLEQAIATNALAERMALEKWGRESAPYASACFNHGRALLYKGVYPEAEKWYLETKTIREKVLGKMHPDYASTLNDLANLYRFMGRFETSESLFKEALAIREKALSKDHPDYARSLNNLAVIYKITGDYEKSERIYLETKALLEKVRGKSHPDYAACLNNLGTLYTDMGEYEKAEPVLLEARMVRENALGKEHPMYALSLNNLAVLYMETGRYEKAEPLYLEAEAIREKVLGKEHPDYANSLVNLANLYRRMRRYEAAEPLYLEAQPLIEKKQGQEHPDYAWLLTNLASLYYARGDYDKAEPLYLQSKSILEKAMGNQHHAYVWSVNNLANLYWSMHRFEKAEGYLTEAGEIERRLLSKSSNYLSERELSSYTEKFRDGLNRDLSFTQLRHTIPGICYDDILFYKGFLLNAVSRIHQLALTDTASIRKFNLLKSFERNLAAEYAKPLAGQKDVAVLEEKVNSLEKDLAHSVAGFADATRQVTWEDVQQKLLPGEAALEFLHYRLLDPQPTDSTMYTALLLLPGKNPVFVPLFEEKQLSALLQTAGKSKTEQIDALYSDKSLYELIWRPLEPQLAGVKTVYFSPSGLLHRLNLGAMPVNGEVLADHFHLIELNSTRQLAVPDQPMYETTTAVLYGGIQFDPDSVAIRQAINDPQDDPFTSPRGLYFNPADSTLRAGNWNYLKWTDVEVGATEAVLSDAGFHPTVLRKYAATEESFKSIGVNQPSPRILHVATHGFFFPDPKQAQKTKSMDQDPVFKISDHPMMRAGLVLAGGNYAWKNGKPFRPGYEDGILTAYEISQMNLRNTELVVLSACETGLGDIQGNEGVYGLQRAFKIAGAQYLIMSLWQVPDFHSQELMTAFYSRWITDKMTIPDAFAAAQKTMREKYKDPFLWAGFILVK